MSVVSHIKDAFKSKGKKTMPEPTPAPKGSAVSEEMSADIFAIQARVQKLMNWQEDKAWMWMGSPNPVFGGISPAEVIINGHFEKLDNFVKGAESEMELLQKIQTEAKVD